MTRHQRAQGWGLKSPANLSRQNLRIAPDARKFIYHDPFSTYRARSIIAPPRPTSRLVARLEEFRKTLRPTPSVPLVMQGMNLFAKLEYVNPFGSIKDRSAYWILKRAAERGDIGEGTTVVESSS